MKKRLLIIPALIALVVILASFGGGTNQDYPSGAPAGYTGSPADGQNCVSCHNGSATTATGIISSNIPGTGYVPGTSYTITATVTGSGAKGFEISPQSITGTLLGTLTAGSNNHITGSKYVTHNAAITITPAVWSFTWVAPVAGTGAVTFYGAFAITKPVTKLSTMVVNEAAAAPVTATATANPTSIVQGATSQLNVTPSGGTGSYTYSWTSVPVGFTSTLKNPVVTPAVTTTYSVLVTSGTQNVSSSALVTVIPTLTASATATPPSIAPGGTSQLNVIRGGGTGSYTYSWTSVPAGFTSTIQNPVVSPTVTTTYSVLVTSGTQNVSSSAVVTLIPTLTASATATPPSIAPGGTSQLNVIRGGGTGSYTYSWTSVPAGFTSTIQNPVVSPTVTTIYSVLVTSGTQTITPTTTVTVSANLAATATANPSSVVAGGTSQLNVMASGGTGSFTYSWTSVPAGFTSTIQNPVVSPTVTTTYSVLVTSGTQNVSSSAVVTLIPTLTASATATPPSIAPGGTSQLNVIRGGGTGSYTYSWTSVPAGFTSTIQNPVVSPTVTTTYSVLVTSGTQTITPTTTVTVSANLAATATANPSSIVAGGTSQLNVMASGGTGSFTYSWTSVPAGFTSTIQNPVVSPTVTTTYSVLVTSGTQNVSSSAVVTVIPTLTASATATPPSIAPGGTSQLNVIRGGGTGSYTYSWTSVPAGFTSTLQNPVVSPTVTTTYSVLVTSGTQTITPTTAVTVSANLAATATANPTSIVAGGTSQLNVTASGGTGSYTYSWTSVPAGFTSTIQNPVVSPTVTTTYSVLVTSGTQTITPTTTVTVSATLAAIATATPASIIEGGTSQLNVTASGGTGTYAYSWTSVPAGFTSSLQNPVVSPIVTTIYSVQVTSGTQNVTSPATVAVIPTLTASATAAPPSITPGGTSQLDVTSAGGTGSYTYAWTSVPGGFTSSLQNPVVTPTVTTIYNVQVTSGTQTANSSTTVTVSNALFVTALANPTTILAGESSQLDVTISGGTGFNTFSWTSVPVGFTSSLQNPVVSPGVTTTYTVLVSSGTETATSSIKVDVYGILSATASANPTTVILGGSSQLDVVATEGDGIYTYSWTSLPAGFTSTLQNPVVSPADTTIYTVQVTSGIQTVSSSVTVNVLIPTGVADKNSDEVVLSVFPNPCSGAFNLAIKGAVKGDAIISIVDLTGRTILNEVTNLSGTQTRHFDISSYPKGIYVIIVNLDNVSHTTRLIVQ